MYENLVQYVCGQYPDIDRGEAEGIVQQVMLTIWEKASSYRSHNDASACSWILTITRNKTIDYLRAMKRMKLDDIEILDTDRRYAYHDELEEFDLDELQKGLTPREKEFVHYLYKGLKQWEIAARLKISESRIVQIREAIRRKKAGFGL